MNISKTNPENNDSKLKTIFPPMMKSGTMESAQSKIPKRDLCSSKEPSVSNLRMKTTKPVTKFSLRKSSASTMNLKLPKTTSLASSRSSYNSSRSVKSKEQTPRLDTGVDKISEIKKKTERAALNRNLQSFTAVKEKLQTCQEQFMSKFDLVRDELPKEENCFQLICLFKNNEGHLVTRNQPSKIITMCDKKTLEELKFSLKNLAAKKLEGIDTFVQSTRSPREIGDTCLKDHENFKQLEEAKKKIQIEMKTFLDDFLTSIESLQANDKLKESTANKELEIKFKSLVDQSNELKKNLEDNQAELTKIKKNCDQKCCTFKKELEEKSRTLSKKQMEVDELKRMCDCLEKETMKIKSISKETSEKLTKKAHEWEDLNEKLKCCARNNVKLEAKNKELELKIDNMKMELNTTMNSDKNLIKDHTDEMNVLKTELINSQKEKENFEKEVQFLKNKTIELQKIQLQIPELQDEVNQANKDKQNLNQTIRDLMEKLEISKNQASVSRDVQEELTKLQRAENLNKEKIKNLENELTKAQFQVKKLEEKIVLDGKLLKVRTDFIDSLQKKDKSQKIRLTDLFAEVGEKNNDLRIIKTEVLTKTEEFKNLFSTLSTKQMELTRQEHVIKLLQENNERAQQLRVRQEAKIAGLEEENLELKQAISIYQDAVLPNSNMRRNLSIAEASRGECADSLGFYVEERRRKRHIDISVKKYEK